MAALDDVRRELAPILTELDVVLYDLEHEQGTLRVLLDAPGDASIDSGTLTRATRAISTMLDVLDPFPGRYTLEVSSPGLERNLRTPAHFADAVGAQVAVKTRPGTEGDRRTRGELLAADDAGVVVADEHGDERRIPYDDIERARTVVDWSRPPKPGRGAPGRTTPTDDSRKAPTS